MSLLYQWRNDGIDAFQLIRGNSKALTAFAADRLILFLGILRIIEMPLQLAAKTFFTTVANIGRLHFLPTDLLLKIRAVSVAGGIALETILFPLFPAGATQVSVVVTGATMNARIKSSRLNHLIVAADLFRNRGRILAGQFSDFLERELIPQGNLDSNSFIKGKMGVFSHSIQLLSQGLSAIRSLC